MSVYRSYAIAAWGWSRVYAYFPLLPRVPYSSMPLRSTRAHSHCLRTHAFYSPPARPLTLTTAANTSTLGSQPPRRNTNLFGGLNTISSASSAFNPALR